MGKKKKVTFDDHVQIKYMFAWSTAYKLARLSPWVMEAVDRFRFEQRIKEIDVILAPVLKNMINKYKKK